jgi:hypothetical protein
MSAWPRMVVRCGWVPVRWLLGLPPPRPVLPTRMTADEVRNTAKAALYATGCPFELMKPLPRRAGERLLWTVDSATIGSGWRVEVDDATGVAGPVSRWGVR